jgi:hydrogenase maturation protein HypF
MDLPRIGVQHHHAHIAGVAAEHGVATPVVGVAFDGTGYGSDGHIWGGEVLVCRWDSFERYAHLREVPLPGGASAIRRPARMAVGELLGLEPELLAHPGAEPLRERLAEGEERVLREMVQGGVNSPLTSSMGRLFDAVASLAGVRDDARYEGQAAIELEALADPAAEGSYRFELREVSPTLIDQRPVLAAVLDDVAAGVGPSVISERFHRAVVDLVVRVAGSAADAAGVRHVALSGGVFMNRRVRDAAVAALRSSGLSPLTHVSLPSNDGGVSFGQAVVAWSRRSEI